jgi:hypothetical protein
MSFAVAVLKLVGVRGIIGLACGLAVMGAWERAPWGLAGRLTASESLADRRAAALTKAATALKIASQAIRDRDAALIENGRQEADDAPDAAKFWRGQCKSAFDAGYASRRCGAGEPDAGGVRDLRRLQEAGAYRSAPADGVPGQPDR